MFTNREDYTMEMHMIHKINLDFILFPCIGLD